jgi:hypothetical protein
MQLASLLKSFSKQRTALASTFDALDEIRAEIDAKSNEIESLRTAPRPVADALSAFDTWCDATATSAIDRVSLYHMLQPKYDGGLRLPSYRARGEAAPNLTGATEILLGLVVLVGRDKLREIVSGQLSDLVQGRETLTAEERAARIAAAEADLLHLHLAEEKLVRAMTDGGLSVTRRADAPALALLADDTALPG